mgnify:CR=1 FL=1|tara:strand:- start:7479 stop:7697 length:219 start_codon:yes stop_codon:yes gene_type:complete
MEEQIISWVKNYLAGGVKIPVIIFLISYVLKTIPPYLDSFLNYYSKIQEIKSNERIEKRKLKAIRHKKKATS